MAGGNITLKIEQEKKNLDSLIEFLSSNKTVNSLLVAEITNGHASVMSKLEQVTYAMSSLGNRFKGVGLTGLLIFNLRDENGLKSSIYDNLAHLNKIRKENNWNLYITLVKEYELNLFKDALLSLEEEEKEKIDYLKNKNGTLKDHSRGKFITPFSLYTFSKLLYENVCHDTLINELVRESSKVGITSLLNSDENTICTLSTGEFTQPYENLHLFKFVFMQEIPEEYKRKIQFGNLINEFKGRIAEVYNQITFLELADKYNKNENNETSVYFGLNNLYKTPAKGRRAVKREMDMVVASSSDLINNLIYRFNESETLLYPSKITIIR